MAFESFMLKPSNEYALFTQIAEEVKNNFSVYHGQHYYIHLKASGERKSCIDEVQDLKKVPDAWHYTYIERDRQACILFRSDKDSIAMLLYGECDSGEIKVTAEKIMIIFGPSKSTLPGARRSGMTAVETMQAFGQIQCSLQESRGQKTS